MKKLLTILILFANFVTGCQEDYTEFNPPAQLDAPTLRVSATGSNQVVEQVNINNWQRAYQAFLLYQEPVQFTVSVIDAPGKVGSVNVTGSVPDFGTITLDESSVTALEGKEQGDFKFTFTPNASLDNQSTTDRPLNLVVTVSDMQKDKDGEDDPKVTTLTIPTVLAGPCLSSVISSGTYKVTSASGNLDGGVAFTLDDLVADAGSDIFVTVSRDRPGVYTIDEVTAGVWPTYYSGRANPALKVNVCNNALTGRSGANVAGAGTAAARTFTLNGTANPDGTITVQWSYVRNDGATPANPAKGTYTLTNIQDL